MVRTFIIKTEQGFYKDFISGIFAETPAEAHVFSNYNEAAQLKKALEVMDGIKEAAILEFDPDMQHLIDLARQYVQEAEINAAANPTSSEILVVVCEPGKKPYKKLIPNELETFKEMVGGWIENLFIGSTKKGARVGIVLNEEGKLIQLPFNRRLVGNRVSDIIVGNFFITAYNLEGDNVSLTDQEADQYIKKFSSMEVYI